MSIDRYNSPVANNIKTILKYKMLRQGAVAREAGFSEQAFCDILNGRRLLKASEIPAIAKALSVQPNDLYGFGRDESA